nr:hypothetical protein [Fusobacterium sp.]
MKFEGGVYISKKVENEIDKVIKTLERQEEKKEEVQKREEKKKLDHTKANYKEQLEKIGFYFKDSEYLIEEIDNFLEELIEFKNSDEKLTSTVSSSLNTERKQQNHLLFEDIRNGGDTSLLIEKYLENSDDNSIQLRTGNLLGIKVGFKNETLSDKFTVGKNSLLEPFRLVPVVEERKNNIKTLKLEKLIMCRKIIRSWKIRYTNTDYIRKKASYLEKVNFLLRYISKGSTEYLPALRKMIIEEINSSEVVSLKEKVDFTYLDKKMKDCLNENKSSSEGLTKLTKKGNMTLGKKIENNNIDESLETENLLNSISTIFEESFTEIYFDSIVQLLVYDILYYNLKKEIRDKLSNVIEEFLIYFKKYLDKFLKDEEINSKKKSIRLDFINYLILIENLNKDFIINKREKELPLCSVKISNFDREKQLLYYISKKLENASEEDLESKVEVFNFLDLDIIKEKVSKKTG